MLEYLVTSVERVRANTAVEAANKVRLARELTVRDQDSEFLGFRVTGVECADNACGKGTRGAADRLFRPAGTEGALEARGAGGAAGHLFR